VNNQLDQVKALQQKKTENDFLMWMKIDKLGDMTELMANKLHEAGVINGDLEDLERKYKEADEKYEEHIHQLAAAVLRK